MNKNDILLKLNKQLLLQKSWSEEKRKKEAIRYFMDPNSLVNKNRNSKNCVQLWINMGGGKRK